MRFKLENTKYSAEITYIKQNILNIQKHKTTEIYPKKQKLATTLDMRVNGCKLYQLLKHLFVNNAS